MRILTSSRSLMGKAGPFAVGIGVFDGVHRGHQQLLLRVRELAARDGIESLAYTFSPHPARVVNPTNAPRLLEPIEDRLEHFAELGLNATLVERFDEEYAATPAERFVDEILIDRLQARHVVVGRGFRFGAGGKGNVELLRERAARHGCEVHPIDPVLIDGERVSSTRIRELVRGGEVRYAARLLGRPFALTGLASRGVGRGRELGFGTANLQVDNEIVPATGVYAAQANGPMGRFNAVVNVGYTPTFGSDVLKVEAHLIDYSGADLYGLTLVLHLVERLRDEQRFPGADALKEQIARDIEAALRILTRSAPASMSHEQPSGA